MPHPLVRGRRMMAALDPAAGVSLVAPLVPAGSIAPADGREAAGHALPLVDAGSLQDRFAHYLALVDGALAPNTLRGLRADIQTYLRWADQSGAPFPSSPADVARFVDEMAGSKAAATVRHYASSIASLHAAVGAPDPCTSAEVRFALKRMHRRLGRAQKQATGLGRKHVAKMLAAAPASTLLGLRDRALLAVAYDTLARRSELAALDMTDLHLDPEGTGTLLIRRSKSDQEGRGSDRFLASDTVTHLLAWIRASQTSERPITAPGTDPMAGRRTWCPLFRSLRNGVIGGPIDPKDVARRFKAMAEAAGLAADLVQSISGHSTRVGAAQDMVRLGVALPAVMQSGDWRSPEMVGRYTRRLEARSSGAAQLAKLQRR